MMDPLSNRMNQWEASPPPGSWEIVSRELKEVNAEKRLALRMESMEAMPPAAAWSTIAAAIEKETPVPAFKRGDVPVRPLFPYLVRYGAAAAVIGCIVWLVSSRSFSGADELTTAALPIPAEKAAPALPPGVNSPAENTAFTDSAPVESNVGPALPGNRPGRSSKRKDPGYSMVKRLALYAAHQSSNWQQEISRQMSFSSLQSLPVQQRDLRYIRVASQNGNQVRLSAKYAPVYYELTNTNESYNALNHPFSSIEKQLLQSHYIPDPGNLFDLLHFKEILEEQ